MQSSSKSQSAGAYLDTDNEYRLVRDLMTSYNKQVKPSMGNNKPLTVTLGVALAQIIDLVSRLDLYKYHVDLVSRVP